jgi:hypothetical protein
MIQEDDSHRASKLSETIAFINTDLNECIRNFSPNDLEELDEKITALFENRHAECLHKYLMAVDEQNQATAESAMSNKAPAASKAPSSPKQKPKSAAKGSSSDAVASTPVGELLAAYFQLNFQASHVQALISQALYQSAAILNKKQLFQQIHDSLGQSLIVSLLFDG